MNNDYASVGISWVLAGTTRTVNADWFDNAGPDSSQQTDMKSALRQGGVNDLNVYSVEFASLSRLLARGGIDSSFSSFTAGSGKGLLGYSTFPFDYASNPKNDGVVFLFSSVPGGTTAPYNLGRVRL